MNSDTNSTVTIGAQEWSSRNLNVAHYQNGDPIFEAKSVDEFFESGDKQIGAYCNYQFKSELGMVHGKLYNWYAVADPRGLAPKGFRVASLDDWNNLAKELGGTADQWGRFNIAEKIKVSSWEKCSRWVGTNESGFNGIPAGMLYIGDSEEYPGFTSLNTDSFWWTSTEAKDPQKARLRKVNCEGSTLGDYWTGGDSKNNGLSVRCIKI